MLTDIEHDHYEGLHDTPVSGCSICEKDQLIRFQASMITMMERSYVDLVTNVDRVLKGVNAYHKTSDALDGLIPSGKSTEWITLDSRVLPLEGEEVNLLLKVTVQGKQATLQTRGFLHNKVWKSWDSMLQLRDVIAWRKLNGQLDPSGFGSKGFKNKP